MTWRVIGYAFALGVLAGLAHYFAGPRQDCPPPSARSVEALFAPCLARPLEDRDGRKVP
jgi:hypothetical protein